MFNKETAYIQSGESGFFRRIHQIDYLRAVAVLGVVANHVFGLSGGFIGVDVFFVISGFVITFLILKSTHQGRFSLAEFYRHRVARIIPPLIVVLVFIYVGAKAMFWLPEDYGFIRDAWSYQAFFIQNIMFAQRAADYFQGLTAAKINLHLWSLAVEEQFYFLYPLLLITALRYWDRVWMRLAIGIVLAGAFFLLSGVYEREIVPLISGFIVHSGEAVSVSGMRYYSLLTRIWELGIGAVACAGAWFAWRKLQMGSGSAEGTTRSWPKLAVALCLAVMLVAMLTIDGTMAWPDVRALAPAFATAMILYLLAVYGASAMPWKSDSHLLGAVGRSSYSLYLWHWPVLGLFIYSNADFGVSPVDYFVYFVAIGILTALTYRLVERNRYKLYGARAASVVFAIFVGLCMLFWYDPRDTSELPAEVRQIVKTGAYAEQCATCVEVPTQPFVVLWGDSHAKMLFDTVGQLVSERGNQLVYIAGSLADSHEKLRALISHPEYRGTILASRWSMYALGFPPDEPEERGNRFLPLDGRLPVNALQASEHFRIHLGRLLDEFRHGPVVLMKEVPRYPFFPKKEAVMEWLGMRWRPLPVLTRSSHEASQVSMNALFARVLPQHQNLLVLDPSVVLCSTGACIWRNGFDVYYKDDDHLSVAGANLLSPEFNRLFSRF